MSHESVWEELCKGAPHLSLSLVLIGAWGHASEDTRPQVAGVGVEKKRPCRDGPRVPGPPLRSYGSTAGACG